MSETPETDSFTHSTDETPLDAWVYAGHAMRLERERDEARMALKHIEEYGTKEINEAVTLRQELAKALLERDEAREENKKFREALEWISKRYDDSKPTHQVAMDAYEMSCTAGSVINRDVEAERVAMEPDWTAIGYREGMSAALHSGGIRGAKWHSERKGLQGEAADNYISGFNTALDEYEQEEAK